MGVLPVITLDPYEEKKGKKGERRSGEGERMPAVADLKSTMKRFRPNEMGGA